MSALSPNRPFRSSLLKIATVAPENGDASCMLTADELKKNLPNRKAVKIMDRRTRLACGACAQMVAAGEKFDEESGIVMAVGPASLGESDISAALSGSPDITHEELLGTLEKNLQPLWLLGRLPNMTAAHVAIQFQILGPSQTCGGGSLAGIQALSCAARWLQTSSAKKVIVGTTESYLEEHWATALSKKSLLANETSTTLILAKNTEPDAIAFVEGPIHIIQKDLPEIQKTHDKAFANAVYFRDDNLDPTSTESWNIGNSKMKAVWRVGEEMEYLASCAIQRKSAAIVRLLDKEHAVIFCIEPAKS